MSAFRRLFGSRKRRQCSPRISGAIAGSFRRFSAWSNGSSTGATTAPHPRAFDSPPDYYSSACNRDREPLEHHALMTCAFAQASKIIVRSVAARSRSGDLMSGCRLTGARTWWVMRLQPIGEAGRSRSGYAPTSARALDAISTSAAAGRAPSVRWLRSHPTRTIGAPRLRDKGSCPHPYSLARKVIGRSPGEDSCLTLVWVVLDLLIIHQTNGIHFNQLDRQRLRQLRYEGAEQTIPEEIAAP